MSESQMYAYLRQKTAGKIHWERITERLRKGVADTVWVERHFGYMGWCELKYLPRIGDDKDWALPDLRKDQVLFLSQQRAAQARSTVLLRVGKPDLWMLFYVPDNPIVAQNDLLRVNPAPMFCWQGFPEVETFWRALAYEGNDPMGRPRSLHGYAARV